MLKIVKSTIILVVLATLITSCEESKPTVKIDKDKSGGVLSQNIISEPHMFPLKATDVFSNRVINNIYEGLVKIDPSTLEVMPAIAEKWEVNEAGTEFTFSLRDDVYFHDSETHGKDRKVTAKDVEFCLRNSCAKTDYNGYVDFLKDKLVGGIEFFEESKKGNLPGNHKGIELVDDKTIKIKLVSANSAILNILAFSAYGIYPYDDNPTDDVFVGSGPFVLENMTSTEISLVKNERYYQKDKNGNQLPYLDGLNFTVSGDGLNEVKRFKNKELDIIIDMQTELIDSLLPDLEIIKKGESVDYGYENSSSLSVFSIYFNHNKELFKSKEFRKAISMSIDREKIVDSILMGDGEPAHQGFLPPFDKMEREENKVLAYNPSEAKRLLMSTGVDYSNAVLNITTTTSQRNINVIEAISNMISTNLNIKIDVDTVEFGTLIKESIAGKYDMWRFSWIADYPDPENFLSMFLTKADKRLNTPGYSSDSYDKAFYEAVSEKDLTKRMEMFKGVDNLLLDDMVVAPIYYLDRSLIFHKNLKNLVLNSIGVVDFTNVYFTKEK